MRIGVPKEIKKHEYRVALTPQAVKSFVARGHEVLVEKGAGAGTGYPDAEYKAAGAKVLPKAQELWEASDMVLKVKEPQEAEIGFLREGLTLFCFLHLAASPALLDELLARKVTAIAYETIELEDGSLPCLRPMSEIAGRLAVQEGAKYLEKEYGGRGILLGGVPGVQRGTVSILGGGVVGLNACKIATGIGAMVNVLDVDLRRLSYFDDIFGSRVSTLHSSEHHIAECLASSDVVIGSVLRPGKAAPKLIRREHLPTMRPGSVIVDVAIDQGGCAESSRPTTHDDPVYVEGGVVHYCVANMPGAVACTSTQALVSATLPYAMHIANQGFPKAARKDKAIALGANCYRGQIVHKGLAESLSRKPGSLEELIG
jgi:alanine dehydrogenase